MTKTNEKLSPSYGDLQLLQTAQDAMLEWMKSTGLDLHESMSWLGTNLECELEKRDS